jgi:hypothetical protein
LGDEDRSSSSPDPAMQISAVLKGEYKNFFFGFLWERALISPLEDLA